LLSCIFVHNEIGVIQPIKEIGRICRENGVFFHSDAAQAVGKIPIDVNDLNIDLLSISAHKIYGPKGIGGLYIRRKPRVRLNPIISGGGQERGFRSGTLATSVYTFININKQLCVGFGRACELAKQDMDFDNQHITKLFNKLYNGLKEKIPEIVLNGDISQRYKGNLNFSFSYVEGESLLMAVKDIAVSSG